MTFDRDQSTVRLGCRAIVAIFAQARLGAAYNMQSLSHNIMAHCFIRLEYMSHSGLEVNIASLSLEPMISNANRCGNDISDG